MPMKRKDQAENSPHEYVSVITDRNRCVVLEVLEDRKKETVLSWLDTLDEGQKQAVQTVSMDMWEPFINAFLERIPAADHKICFDRFHVASYFGKAVDAVRIAEHKAIKEQASKLWSFISRTWAEKGWRRLLGWMDRSRLEPIKKVAATVKTHLWGILNAVVTSSTNAIGESLNARIQKIKAMACGFRNRQRFRRAILFHLGGLDLMPSGAGYPTHTKA